MTSDERLIAYVDGELAAEDRARFEARMAADPVLARQVAQHRALAQQVNAAFAPVLEEPVPPQLVAAASVANDRGRPRPARIGPWAAVAASLVVGLLAGRVAWPPSASVVEEGGALTAHGALAQALDAQLAAEPGVVKVDLTFRTADGRYCRTFESAADHLAGLACRNDGHWSARTVSAWAPAGSAAGYRTAGSETPPEVLAAVDGLIAGQPLDASAERAARDRRWK